MKNANDDLDKLSLEIAKFALYELKNEITVVSEMRVEEQEEVQRLIQYAAQIVLHDKLKTGRDDSSALAGS